MLGGFSELERRSSRSDILGREESREVHSNDFVLTVAVDVLGAAIPARDVTVRIQHEDRVILDARDHEPESFLALPHGLFGAPLCADVSEHEHRATRAAAAVAD